MRLRHSGMVALLLLCGCSSAPSASDIQNAMQEVSDTLLGPGTIKIEKISDVACRDAQGKPGVVCSFSGTAFNKIMNSRATQVNEGRFVLNGSRWVFMADK